MAVEGVRHHRTARAALLPLRAEHEVVDDQLASAVEKISERFLPVLVLSKEYCFSTFTQGGRDAWRLTRPRATRELLFLR